MTHSSVVLFYQGLPSTCHLNLGVGIRHAGVER
jgi:hypothetical protein